MDCRQPPALTATNCGIQRPKRSDGRQPLIPPGARRRQTARRSRGINDVPGTGASGARARVARTVHDYLGLWNWDGTLDRIHRALDLKCRSMTRAKRAPRPASVGQSVKSREKDRQPRLRTASADRKTPSMFMIDHARLAAAGIVTAADVQDRDGGLALLGPCSVRFPFRGSPTAVIRARSTAPWPASCPISRPRSSSDPIG